MHMMHSCSRTATSARPPAVYGADLTGATFLATQIISFSPTRSYVYIIIHQNAPTHTYTHKQAVIGESIQFCTAPPLPNHPSPNPCRTSSSRGPRPIRCCPKRRAGCCGGSVWRISHEQQKPLSIPHPHTHTHIHTHTGRRATMKTTFQETGRVRRHRHLCGSVFATNNPNANAEQPLSVKDSRLVPVLCTQPLF